MLDNPFDHFDFVTGYLSKPFQLPKSQNSLSPDAPPKAKSVPGGRGSPFYLAHSYHTKVPPEAIEPFIEHFTKPGDVVLDPFCGSGMTGVAASMLGRQAIVNDLSPAAAHLAWNHTRECDPRALRATYQQVEKSVLERLGGLYATKDESGKPALINWTIWSTHHSCPNCGGDFLLWDTFDRSSGRMGRDSTCPQCKVTLNRRQFATIGNVPAWISFTRADGSRGYKSADPEDVEKALRLSREAIEDWYPDTPLGPDREMYQRCALHLQGILSVADMYTTRNLMALAVLWSEIRGVADERIRRALAFAFTNTAWHGTRMRRFNARGGHRPLTGTLYVPQLSSEANVLDVMRKKIGQLGRYFVEFKSKSENPPAVTIGSASSLDRVENASVDYVFTDPPFGSNIFYADCNVIWESWLGRLTDVAEEAVVNKSLKEADGGKSLNHYATVMASALSEMHRVLKPGGWATIVFHNTDSAVWGAIRQAADLAGFEFHEAASLDRKQQSHKGYKGREGIEDVAHFDVIMNLRKPLSAIDRMSSNRRSRSDLAELVDRAAQDRSVAVNGLQGIHAEVMRQLISEGSGWFPDFADIRKVWEARHPVGA
ncbi:DNA methyltransferase [Rhizobium rhizoryzae]|uniref:DNA methyltransferase n=1 Tax=Rhizobium rhizoryzae TaxID=451876 RepID=UPI0028A0D51A|nr:DNA methyltransferase [Rhizobium rhizoryzae]